PMAFPAEHAKSRHTHPRQRRANEVGHRAEILRDDLGARITEDGEHALAERELIRFLLGREGRIASIVRRRIRAIEPDQMDDAEPVEEIRAAARAVTEPSKAAGTH